MLTQQKDAFLSQTIFYSPSTEYAVPLELERFLTDMSLFERYLFTPEGMWRVKELHTNLKSTRLYQMYLDVLNTYGLKEADMTECLNHYTSHCSQKYLVPVLMFDSLEERRNHPNKDALELIQLCGTLDYNFSHPALLEGLAAISFTPILRAVVDDHLLHRLGKRYLDAIWTEVTNYLNKEDNGDDTFRPITDLFAEEDEIEWFVDGVFPKGSLSVLSGAPKAGKTSLARWLIVGLSKGTEWLGCCIPEPVKVGYFCCDDPKPLFIHVMKLAYQEVGFPDDEYMPTVQFNVNPALLLKTLRDAVEKGTQFFILDTLFDALNVENTNDYAEMKPVMGILNRFCRKNNVHILCVHHNNKTSRGGNQDGILGSQAIAGSSAHNITVWCDDENDENTARYIKSRNRYPDFLKGKSFRGEEFSVTQKDCTLSARTAGEKKASKQIKMIIDIFGYVWGSKEPVTKQEIEENVKGTATAIRKMVDDLLKKDILARNRKKFVVHPKYSDMPEETWKQALLSYLGTLEIPVSDPE